MEFLTLKLKGAAHDATGLTAAMDASDFGNLENGGVEIDGFFGIALEPEEGRDFLHAVLLFIFRSQQFGEAVVALRHRGDLIGKRCVDWRNKSREACGNIPALPPVYFYAGPH
jgi:hypothetical protein